MTLRMPALMKMIRKVETVTLLAISWSEGVSIEHMKTHSLLHLLDETLGDSQIHEDLLKLLQTAKINGDAVIEIEGTRVRIPLNVGLFVVTKAVFKDLYNSGFGTLRAQVAIGNVINHEDGEVVAKYCFATLYYDENGKLISNDFHKQLR